MSSQQEQPWISAGRLDAISEESAGEASRLAAIVESTSDMVSTATPDGRVLYLNAAGRRMLGVRPDVTVSGITIANAHPSWQRELIFGKAIPTAIAEGSWSGETVMLSMDGREVPVSQVIIAHKDADGTVQYLSTIARDISQEKKDRELHLELERKLQEAIESKDEFLGLLSHETRNWVTSIAGASRLLRSGSYNLQLEDREALLGDIGNTAEKLQRLIDDLLILSQAELASQIQMEPVTLRHIITAAVAGLESGDRQREILVEVEKGLPLAAGKDGWVERVVLNLLSNAHKYTSPELPIEVTARRSHRSSISVSVRDYGPGIGPDEAEAIFGRFYRSQRTARKAGGLGLGLIVCRRLVEAMGGQILAGQAQGGGLEVTFTLRVYIHQ